MTIDPGTAALLGAFIGASAGLIGGISLEMFKRGRDGQATALALASSIEANLWIAERRGHVETFTEALPRLDRGESISFEGFVDPQNLQDDIAQKYIDRIGLLHGDLGSRVVRFYTILSGIRIDIAKIAAGQFENPQQRARLIRQDLHLWKEAQNLGHDLVRDLRGAGERRLRRSLRRSGRHPS